MSWRKHFTPVHNESLSPVSGHQALSKIGPARANYSSYLPDVYSGSPNRTERYQQYEVMDSDPEVNAALDILAEFCTQKTKSTQIPFSVLWRSKATNSEIKILSEYLSQWTKLQKFDTRIFRIVRNIFKYGDAFFIRDPENQKWSWVDPSKVVKIIVNESDGKAPEQYIMKDLAPNFENLVATQITPNINSRQVLGAQSPNSGFSGSNYSQAGHSTSSASSASRFGLAETERAIDSEHVVHLSLSEGLDNNYPFGTSLLENVYKVYKQKELLEDAILIYRIQRAPERRVFHIDVGNMPTHLAMSFVERVKNEIHQRRIPSQSGSGTNVIDSTFNALGQNEDFFFPRSCLALDTKIKLLDDRNLTLQELITDYENGITNIVYTVNQSSLAIEPGKIVWAGVTRKNATVIKVILDDNSFVVVTPDHRFIMRDGFELEAANLYEGAEIMSVDPDVSPKHQINHTVKEIKKVTGKIDTGDLTIESVNDNHNFALSCGIFVHNSDGRGSDVTTLPGGSQVGEITDLQYFTNKLFRGLRIPSSYLPTGAEDSQTNFNDGRVGTAYIQELRFNKYCERLQSLLTEVFDNEFKLYMHSKGVNIDAGLFELQFNPPMNFASTRQSALDSERINTFNTIQQIPFMSKRFALKRFLDLSEEECAENERLWAEEQGKGHPTHTDAAGELRSAGLSAAGISGELNDASNMEAPADMPLDAPGAQPGMAPAMPGQMPPPM
jgi:hypothetical protein